MLQNSMLKKYFCISVFTICAYLISIGNCCFAQDVEKVVFCSINQRTHRLYQISNAVLTKAFRNLGVEFTIREYPAKRIPLELNIGKIDGDTHRIYDFNSENKYPNLIRVEEPIQVVHQSVFSKLNGIKIDGWESLRQYKILYIKGIKVIEEGLELAKFPKENCLGVYNIDSAFELLNVDRGDIVIVSPSTGRNTLKKLELTNSGIKILSPPLITIDLYPYMNKKHAVLAKKLADEIKSMKANGEYDKILNSISE